MKRVLVFLFSIALLTACGMGKKDNSNAGNSNTASSEKTAEAKPPAPAVGDVVVAHWAGNTWSEGKVDSIEGPHATIVWRDNASPTDVDLVDIYHLPQPAAPATVKSGDY